MAAYTEEQGSSLVCGAAIINENTLLTAAHCILFADSSTSAIFYNTTIFYEGIRTNISQAFMHPNFTGDYPSPNDIGVLKIDPPLVFSETVQPIKLPQSNTPSPEGKVAKFAGWGRTSLDSLDPTTKLQKINLTIINTKTCEEIYKGINIVIDPETQICVQADISGGKIGGPCNGDSGSPLVIDGVTYGITSEGPGGCANSSAPIIFTRVAAYLDWLSDKL
ncbi:unnamed protein product [Psylliodes chrysocephalus]|nr:unnamed protein product [Psylliodes chrysocephala]